jgi:hypothetical protein
MAINAGDNQRAFYQKVLEEVVRPLKEWYRWNSGIVTAQDEKVAKTRREIGILTRKLEATRKSCIEEWFSLNVFQASMHGKLTLAQVAKMEQKAEAQKAKTVPLFQSFASQLDSLREQEIHYQELVLPTALASFEGVERSRLAKLSECFRTFLMLFGGLSESLSKLFIEGMALGAADPLLQFDAAYEGWKLLGTAGVLPDAGPDEALDCFDLPCSGDDILLGIPAKYLPLLRVQINEAKLSLPDKKTRGTGVYLEIQLRMRGGPAGGTVCSEKTAVIKGKNCTWNHSCDFGTRVESLMLLLGSRWRRAELCFLVWDKFSVRKDQLLGFAVVMLSDLHQGSDAPLYLSLLPAHELPGSEDAAAKSERRGWFGSTPQLDAEAWSSSPVHKQERKETEKNETLASSSTSPSSGVSVVPSLQSSVGDSVPSATTFFTAVPITVHIKPATKKDSASDATRPGASPVSEASHVSDKPPVPLGLAAVNIVTASVENSGANLDVEPADEDEVSAALRMMQQRVETEAVDTFEKREGTPPLPKEDTKEKISAAISAASAGPAASQVPASANPFSSMQMVSRVHIICKFIQFCLYICAL